MKRMAVVNASPLIVLARIGRLGLITEVVGTWSCRPGLRMKSCKVVRVTPRDVGLWATDAGTSSA